ncbi:MAG TPA: MarR family winged helix-turn-helix transcriptional regulator [Roseiarcus sp.]|nr:MarR family winged helix-turn-helix transcriptional regulator [Roseiarcus sp.]
MSGDAPSQNVVTAWARLIRAQRAALAGVEADLKQAGWPPLGWYDALLELKRSANGALRPLELESRLLLAQHNISRLIDRLEAKGYVERRPYAADGRGQLVAITAAGRALIKGMWPAYRAAIQRHVGAKLRNEAEADQLATLLGRLIATEED